jgi:hypothetical protein
VLASLKHSTACNQERGDPVWTAFRRSKHVPRDVAGYHQVAVVCSVYVHEFRSDTDSSQQIPPGGTRDQTLAHYSVVRESDPASRKLHGSGPKVAISKEFVTNQIISSVNDLINGAMVQSELRGPCSWYYDLPQRSALESRVRRAR